MGIDFLRIYPLCIMYILLLITLALIGAAFFVFGERYRTSWIISSITALVLSLIIIGVRNNDAEWKAVRDVEYWGGYVTNANYFEPWNEKVSCRHAVYRTERYSYSCGTSSKPKTCRGSRQVFDHWQHPFDVDDHPAHWEKEDTLRNQISISQDDYNNYVKQFGNQTFVDLNRDYYTIDGNEYTTKWNGERDKIDTVSEIHEYVNRVQASNSILKFTPVSSIEAKKLGLIDYPQIDGLGHCDSVLGAVGDQKSLGEARIGYINAMDGSKYQVRVFVLIFQNTSVNTAIQQESYWQRGNKNELVLCVGVDKSRNVTWAYPFSWTDQEGIKTHLKYKVMEQLGKKFDIVPVADYLETIIPKEWKRKQFKDFDYLTINVKQDKGEIFWTGFFVFLSSGVCLTAGLIIVINQP